MRIIFKVFVYIQNTFFKFEVCYVSSSVISFQRYFYACIDIVNLIGGSLSGEHIVWKTIAQLL